MNKTNKGLFFISLLVILSFVLASCAPQAQEIIKTVVVTEIVEKEGEQVVVTQVVEVPAEPVEEEAAGPIPADEMIPCQPVPEIAGINTTLVSAGGPAAPKIVSDVPETVTLPTKKLLQEGNVYKVGVFEDVTTTNFWAANGPDNTVWNSYMLPKPPSLFILTDKYFTLVPQLAAVTTADPLVQEGDFWVTTVPMKQDVVWSDGTPLTAKDAAFTANAVLDLGLISGNFQSWYDGNYLEKAEAVDDYNVKYYYHTKPGLARHEWGTLQAPILSAAYWEPIVTEALAPIQALGDSPSEEDLAAAQAEAHDLLFSHQVSGEPTADAYMLDKWEQGAFLQSIANPNYFETGLEITQYADGSYSDSTGVVVGDPKETAETTYTIGPYFDAVVYTIYGSQDAAILAMKNGEVDFVINPLGLQAGLEAQVRSDPNLTWVENPVNGYRYLSFNNRRRPMNDCAFRQAVAVLIDKEFVTQTVLQGQAFPMYTFLPQANTAWYYDDVPKLGQGLSREQRTNLAVAILEQAGYTWEGDVKPTWDADNRQVTQAGRLIMPDGTPVPELHMPAPSPGYDPLRSTFAIWIETWLQEFGIPLTADLAGFNVIVPIIFTEQAFDMYILGWSLSLFPDFLRDFFAEEQAVQDGNNAGGYINPTFEELSTGILTCETLEDCRQISNDLQTLLATELPYVLLFDTGIKEAYRTASILYPFEQGLSGLQYAHQLGGRIQSTVSGK